MFLTHRSCNVYKHCRIRLKITLRRQKKSACLYNLRLRGKPRARVRSRCCALCAIRIALRLLLQSRFAAHEQLLSAIPWICAVHTQIYCEANCPCHIADDEHAHAELVSLLWSTLTRLRSITVVVEHLVS